jgi:galactokinase
MMELNKILKEYAKYNDYNPVVISAPGRINLIGEHTDYNHGFVLPAAIDKRMIIALGKTSNTKNVKIKSIDFDEEAEIDLTNLLGQRMGWEGYIQAILCEAVLRNLTLEGFNSVFTSDIPLGAGMSSSAALCCGFLSALNVEFEWNLAEDEIAKMGQASEHRLGANVGLMDQFAVMYGKRGHALFLDCRDYSHYYFPLDLKDYSLVLINTNVKHKLVDSAYNDRRASCERTLAYLQKKDANIKTLRDVTLQILEDNSSIISSDDLQRVRFVINENERVQKTTEALSKGLINEVGHMLYQSHEGLRKEYKVSCAELDLLIDLTRNEKDVLGARMMGGGFGGCTINLIKSSEADSIIKRIKDKYQEQTKIQPESYFVSIEDGVTQVAL